MSEFEDRLGAILGNPDAMAQILSLARDLGGPAPEEPSPPPPSFSAGESPPPDLSGLSGLFGEIDPQTLQTGLELLSRFSAADDERTALLTALKPFLKQERYAKMDRAIQIARLSRIVRTALRLFQERGETHV